MSEIVKKNEQISENKQSLSNELLNQIVEPSIDLSIDYSEIFVDDLIESEILREIPLVKTIVGTIKAGSAINQFWFAKKLLTFVQQFNNGKAEPNQIAKYKKKLEEDPRFGKKIAEKLMVFIDRNIEIIQTKIIANLFQAYINERISFDDFNNILITLDRLDPKTYNAFFEMEVFEFTITEQNHKDIGQRNHEMESLINNSGFGLSLSSWFHGFKLTDDGRKMFDFGLKPLKK